MIQRRNGFNKIVNALIVWIPSEYKLIELRHDNIRDLITIPITCS